jgi:hypothetical protein
VPESSWMKGHCIDCDYPVVVTQPSDVTKYNGKYYDYSWYCSNPDCDNHSPPVGTGDMIYPEWVYLNNGVECICHFLDQSIVVGKERVDIDNLEDYISIGTAQDINSLPEERVKKFEIFDSSLKRTLNDKDRPVNLSKSLFRKMKKRRIDE